MEDYSTTIALFGTIGNERFYVVRGIMLFRFYENSSSLRINKSRCRLLEFELNVEGDGRRPDLIIVEGP